MKAIRIRFQGEKVLQLLRTMLYGVACFGLGMIFAIYFVTFQQTTLLSQKVKELTAQTERLIKYETHLRTFQHEVDERLQEFTSRFTRIEHLMRIPRYKRAEADNDGS